MNDTQKKILAFTQKLQEQEDLPLWKVANEKLGYAIATGGKIVWGPRTSVLYRLVCIAYKIHATDILIFIVGLSRAFAIWWKIKNTNFAKKQVSFKKIFAGFGASSEEYLYEDYVRQSTDKILRINWVTHKGVAELVCPNLMTIFFLVAKNSFGYSAKVKKAIPEISENALNFITVYILNIGIYSFYRAFFYRAKLLGIEEVTFLALDMPAYACLDENIKTIYLQHGLMAFSAPIPKVHRINVLTSDEENFFKSTLNNIQVCKNKKIVNIKNNTKTLMILSMNISQEERLLLCNPLIYFAKTSGLQIVIRPTSSVTEEQLNILQKNIPQAICDDLTIPLHDSFSKWRPKFVAAWSSTGLATALEAGCMPISLYDPNANHIWDNMIYPMRQRALFWPRDEALIKTLAQFEEAYQAQLLKLRNYQFSI